MRRATEQMRHVVVFAGPSLGPNGLPEGLDAEILGPAAQGDIVAAVQQNEKCVIALIDGLFQGVPAVRHKEILWALDQGALVYGAASMGAMRAAELSLHGMQGRGLVYRWLRRYSLVPDDAVAVLHAPQELGGGAITNALVDLRMSFKRAMRAGLVDRTTADDLAKIAEKLHYTRRTMPNVLRDAARLRPELADLDLRILNRSQKQQDAELLLRELRDRQKDGVWPVPASVPKFFATDVFLHDMVAGGFSLDTLKVD